MFRALLVAATLAFASTAAFAGNCPVVMGEIDAALQTASLSEADMTKVKELRAKGEELHAAGDHAGSMAALNEAKGLLGM
jgi:hypothetical protein